MFVYKYISFILIRPLITKMSTSKELDIRLRIGKFTEINKNWRKSDVVKHFQAEGIPRRTVYDILKRFEDGVAAERKPGSGLNKVLSIRKRENIIETAINEVGMSHRLIARKNGTTHPTVKKVLSEAEVKRKPRIKCPKSNEKQKKTQRNRLDKLRKSIFKAENQVIVVMDDESYFTTDGSDTNYNSFYYSHECMAAPEEVTHRSVGKFPKKVLVWMAISPKGRSEPYIVTSGNAVTAAVYIKECLPKLKKFIDTYHRNDNYIFWPDLAPAHYAKDTIKAYEELNIKFVPKILNPPNVPQLRPIEDFWGILGRKLYQNGWTCDDIKELTKRILYLIRSTPIDSFRSLMEKVPAKLRKAANQGVFSVLH